MAENEPGRNRTNSLPISRVAAAAWLGIDQETAAQWAALVESSNQSATGKGGAERLLNQEEIDTPAWL